VSASAERSAGAELDLGLLRRGRWFGGLPPALQQSAVQRSVVRSYSKGARIVAGGVPSRGLFALLEGRVHVRRSASMLMHVGEAGFWFGEYSLLSGEPAIGDVVAATSVRTRFLPAAEFERIVAEEPRHFRAFASLLIDRYAIVLRQMSDIKGLPAEERVRMQLVNLAALRRLDAHVDGPVEISVSQAELASMVGLSRQTLCALLRRLQDRGLVEVAFRRIRVHGPELLRQSSPAGNDARDSRLVVGRIAPGAARFDSRIGTSE
jgi:CRP/FNR family transcriptional regulator, cyclic AMP receptor protein